MVDLIFKSLFRQLVMVVSAYAPVDLIFPWCSEVIMQLPNEVKTWLEADWEADVSLFETYTWNGNFLEEVVKTLGKYLMILFKKSLRIFHASWIVIVESLLEAYNLYVFVQLSEFLPDALWCVCAEGIPDGLHQTVLIWRWGEQLNPGNTQKFE